MQLKQTKVLTKSLSNAIPLVPCNNHNNKLINVHTLKEITSSSKNEPSRKIMDDCDSQIV